MPVSFATLFRIAVTLALALHVFYMYCLGRNMGGAFGFNWISTAVASGFALIMLIPLVWAVTIPEAPEIYLRHARPRRWWRQGRCPACGYPREGIGDDACPECGALHASPPPYQVSSRTIALFISLNLLAWLIGCAAGEVMILLDEHRFRDEVAAYVQAGGEGRYSRARIWPLHNSGMVYAPGQGIQAQD